MKPEKFDVYSGNASLIYPYIGSILDLGWIRISGVGLGNALFVYFNALILARKTGAVLITPAWFSVKIGHKLRKERANRRYILHSTKDQISGIDKLRAFIHFFWFKKIRYINDSDTSIDKDCLNIYRTHNFSFAPFLNYRNIIRADILNVFTAGQKRSWEWGKRDFAAIHVRLGDFAKANAETVATGRTNTRIPMEWYVSIAQELIRRRPNLEIRIFSDGSRTDLYDLLRLGAIMQESITDSLDLLTMSSASLLVGSNSTFSYWAAYLGNMPSIWLKTQRPREKMTNDEIPFVELDLAPTLRDLDRVFS